MSKAMTPARWLCFSLLALLAWPVLASTNSLEPAIQDRYYGEWLLEVSPLISEKERRVFAGLETTTQYESFLRHFWQARDPEPEEPGNDLRDRFLRNVDIAWSTVGDLRDDRARTVILHGPPRYTYHVACSELRPLDLYHYPSNDHRSESVSTVFVHTANGQVELWTPKSSVRKLAANLETWIPPAEGTPPLSLTNLLDRAAASGCFVDRENVRGFLSSALQTPQKWAELQRQSPFPEPEAISGWVDIWAADSAPAEVGLPRSLDLDLAFPDTADNEILVQGTWRVPISVVASFAGDQSAERRLGIRGEFLPIPVSAGEVSAPGPALRSKRAFRQQFHLDPDQTIQDSVDLAFFTALPSGAYTLVLRLESPDGTSLLYGSQPIRVPADPDTVAPLRTPNNAIGGGLLLPRAGGPTLAIQPLPGIQVGTVTAEVATTGSGIAAVRYELDGAMVKLATEAPWSAQIHLGSRPRPHTLRAVALNKNGTEVAGNELQMNSGIQRFAIQLVEPWPGAQTEGPLRARALVDLPPATTLDRVEFFVGEEPVATLFESPFVHPLPIRAGGDTTYIKAVATLQDGTSTADIVLVNAPGQLDQIDVKEIELFAKVFRRKRPVFDLKRDEVVVFENGVEQAILNFEHVLDLPVHIGLVIDSSTSMTEELPIVVNSAQRFFATLLSSDDQASVVTFDDTTRLAVPLTRDLDWLADGVSLLYPKGGTALWDSIVTSLDYFNGLTGKRALILASDGGDQHSVFEFEDTLEYARRAGIAVYTLFLDATRSAPTRLKNAQQSGFQIYNVSPDLARTLEERRERLKELAEETGGLFFSVSGQKSLDRALEAIDTDVRAQYLISFQSSNQGKDFREVEVKTSRGGLIVRTLKGYYP